MAGEAEQLVVSLEARIRDFERNMARAQRTANDNFTGIERRARVAGRNLETAMATSTNAMSRSLDGLGRVAAGKVGAAFAAITAGIGLNELRKTADDYTKIMNTLKVAGVKDADLPGTFDKLFQSAQRNAAPLDALATLYGRVSAAQTTLKASSQEVMRVTDITAQALRVGGTSASQASGALLQLGQSLAGGKVQAEEYNSLLDGMRPLLEAAAAGLSEAGGDVAKLTALVKDGKVSSEAFFRAILAGAPILEEKLAGSVTTTEQAMQRLQNEFVKAVGEFDKATGASAALAGAIDGLAGSIGGIGTAATGAVTGVQALINKVGELAQAHAGAQRAQALTYQEERARRTDAAREMGLANAGGRDKLASERAAADAAAAAASRQAVSGFRASEIDYSNRLTTTTLPPARPKGAGSNIKPVSLADYAVPGESGKGGGGGGGSGAEKQSRFDRDIAAIQRRTEALRLEADMVGRGKQEVEKAKIALQLEQAAKRDGIAITDQMRTAIDAAATGYANAKLKVEDLKNSLDGVKQAQQFVGQEIVDSFIDVVVEGKNATEVVQNLAKALLKAAIQGALLGSGPFGKLFGGGGSDGGMGGLLGFIPKLFGFAEGGFTGAGGKYEPAGIVHRGEFVMSKAATSRIGVGNLEAMHRGALKGYDVGGLVGGAPISAPSLPDTRDLSATTMNSVSQNVTVNVTGGSSGDAKADQKFAELIGRRVQDEMRAMIGSEIRAQLRPGGVIREYGR
ncbi:MAG TPA: tape measure protein [Bosea sp. (in: a-proteobacteria)]|jgi:tape measure domain-containing protein|uniref:tape measure protein n=1 Tax=Bosea sp. (in: a-proteobacteria) TaxID=1871050 RepID=UPI002E10D918|nr:tape measure protein [Bosea sp. (in: a-proteobacteria)]